MKLVEDLHAYIRSTLSLTLNVFLKVLASLGDANAVLRKTAASDDRPDVVDLDPYGNVTLGVR